MSNYTSLPSAPNNGNEQVHYTPANVVGPPPQQGGYVPPAPGGGQQYQPAFYPQYQQQQVYSQYPSGQQPYGNQPPFSRAMSHPPPQLLPQRNSVTQRINGGFSDPLRGSSLDHFMYGFKFFFGSVKFLFTRWRIWPHLVAPLLITFLAFCGLVLAALFVFGPLINLECPDVTPHHHSPYGGDNDGSIEDLGVLCRPGGYFLVFFAVIIGTYLALRLSVKICGVCISKEVEAIETGEASFGPCISLECLFSPCMWIFEIVSETLLLMCCSALNIIPMIGQVCSFMALVFVVSMLNSKFGVAIVTGRRHHLGCCAEYRELLSHKALWFGFGCGAMLLAYIPLLQIPALLCAVIGTTRIYLRLEYHGYIAGSLKDMA